MADTFKVKCQDPNLTDMETAEEKEEGCCRILWLTSCSTELGGKGEERRSLYRRPAFLITVNESGEIAISLFPLLYFLQQKRPLSWGEVPRSSDDGHAAGYGLYFALLSAILEKLAIEWGRTPRPLFSELMGHLLLSRREKIDAPSKRDGRS